MKVYKIWEKVKNEPLAVRNMILAALNKQLEDKFKQFVDDDLKKYALVDDRNQILNYYDLEIMNDEELSRSRVNEYPRLMLYRELLLSDHTFSFFPDDAYHITSNGIDIHVSFNDKSPSEAALKLLSNVMDVVYETEFLDDLLYSLFNIKICRECV